MLDLFQNVVRKRQKLEAEPAHPLRPQRAIELDPLPYVDRLLTTQRQTVGVFRDGDLRQKRFGREAALEQVSRRLNHPLTPPVGVFRATRDDHPELRRRHVQTLRHILADQDLRQPFAAGRRSGSMTISTRSR